MIQQQQKQESFWKKYWVELLTFFFAVAVFAPSLAYGFQMDWDDAHYVVDAAEIYGRYRYG